MAFLLTSSDVEITMSNTLTFVLHITKTIDSVL